jgi:hypothetical protein
MPRNVRNFWIQTQIDGRNSSIGAGPVRKDGGFDLTVYQRDAGEVRTALEIIGRAHDDGSLLLRVSVGNGFPPQEIVINTNR